MGNAAVAFDNLADDADVTVSSEQILLPASNLQQADIAVKWRSAEAGAGAVVADLGAMTSIDTVALIGTTMSAAGEARVRYAAADSSGQAGDVYDSGWTAVDETYHQMIDLRAAVASARYVRVDLRDPGAAYIEAGRLFIGRRNGFAINFDYNWAITTLDRSIVGKTRGGQTMVWRDSIYRTIELTVSQLSEADRYGFVETIERQAAQKNDVLFILDPDSAALARDSIWGLISGATPIVNPYPDRFSKSYKIEERL